jgi:hypothetical protein
MEDKICDCDLGLLKQSFSYRYFVSEKKVTETDKPIFPQKWRKTHRIDYAAFLIIFTKLIIGCVVIRNLQHCTVSLVSFLKVKELFGHKVVLVTVLVNMW